MYEFAENKTKLLRAISAVGTDEQEVKAEYIKIGGKISDDEKEMVAMGVIEEVIPQESLEEIAEEITDEQEEIEETEENTEKLVEEVKLKTKKK